MLRIIIAVIIAAIIAASSGIIALAASPTASADECQPGLLLVHESPNLRPSRSAEYVQ